MAPFRIVRRRGTGGEGRSSDGTYIQKGREGGEGRERVELERKLRTSDRWRKGIERRCITNPQSDRRCCEILISKLVQT